jgi:hypothetical protein
MNPFVIHPIRTFAVEEQDLCILMFFFCGALGMCGVEGIQRDFQVAFDCFSRHWRVEMRRRREERGAVGISRWIASCKHAFGGVGILHVDLQGEDVLLERRRDRYILEWLHLDSWMWSDEKEDFPLETQSGCRLT